MAKRVLGLLCAVAWATWSGGAEPEKGWHDVRADALQALFADQDLGDGVHYAYQFRRGGLLTGMNMGKPIEGRWKVAGHYLCYRWNRSGSDEECYEIRQRGQAVRMFLDGYEAFSGNLTPIQSPAANGVKP